MKKAMFMIFSLSLLGCSSTSAITTQNEKSDTTMQGNLQPLIDQFTFDPLSRVKLVDLPTYYNRVFKDLKPYLKDRYPNAYVSSPNAYVIDDVITAYTPWVPTSSEYTVFPTAHYLLITEVTDVDITTHRFNHEQVINLLKQEYEVFEETTPFFHYVLRLTPKQQVNFEQEVIEKLKQLDYESSRNELL
ncbi:hypothetical protein [Enterovibrio coralii]|uniref:Uncharacterized protein n=1 Tax=Enterovibrio coralii TaxID=294935 RepID=A0A135ICP9_9GAMM|nr:hypothetical protein [Enterovibrio coralii]KXF83158.1 hypothetical protein ATN88_05510 [Enterovibrio coralii]